MLSRSLVARINASVQASPLGDNELRRLEDVGGHYFCGANASLPDDFVALASFELASKSIILARRLEVNSIEHRPILSS